MVRSTWILVFAITTFLGFSAQGQVRIGVVDMQRALVSVNEGKKAKEKLESEAKKREREIKQKEERIAKFRDELKKEMESQQQVALPGSGKREEAMRQKAAQYEQMLFEYQELVLKHQKALADMEAELMRPIVERFNRILQEIGAKEGYTVIIEKSAVLFNAAATDLTDRLIQEFNAGKGK